MRDRYNTNIYLLNTSVSKSPLVKVNNLIYKLSNKHF